jgi:hypothetical protein
MAAGLHAPKQSIRKTGSGACCEAPLGSGPAPGRRSDGLREKMPPMGRGLARHGEWVLRSDKIKCQH